MKKKILYLFFTSVIIFNLTACQKDASENKYQLQKEEIIQTQEVETESTSQTDKIIQIEEVESESVNQTEEIADVVQNEYFSVVFDSVTENEDFYIFNFVFTNVSDISYYKGDEQYHPGEAWEKSIKIVKDKLQDYCKNPNFIHYKLYDLSG